MGERLEAAFLAAAFLGAAFGLLDFLGADFLAGVAATESDFPPDVDLSTAFVFLAAFLGALATFFAWLPFLLEASVLLEVPIEA